MTTSWKLTGNPHRYCTACNAPIRFVRNKAGRPEPINMATGLNHFKDCPQPARFAQGTRDQEARQKLADNPKDKKKVKDLSGTQGNLPL